MLFLGVLKREPNGHAIKKTWKKGNDKHGSKGERSVFSKKKQVLKKALKRLGIENKEGGAGGQ